MEETIGARVAQLIDELQPPISHRQIADQVGMTADAFSRALNDKRSFSSIELARVADTLDTDVYWLITGTTDPNRLVLAARHDYDHETRQHLVPSREADESVLRDIHNAYRQAFTSHIELKPLPDTASALRVVLGEDFVRPFIERVETRVGVDVIRMAELGTAYSFVSAGRRVIAIPAKGNWFRENWDLAHEFAHLAGHESEPAANAFAAELLLPESVVASVSWETVSEDDLAEFIWTRGVSTDALLTRLQAVHVRVSATTTTMLQQPTQRLLRHHLRKVSDPLDLITQRMDQASKRRFPLALQEAHQEAISTGKVGPGFLAWMLGVDAAWLEVDTPGRKSDTGKIDELASALGLPLS